MIWRILKFIQHLFYLRHRQGHGIHSPYLFEFVNEVLFNSRKTEVPEKICKEHGALMKERAMIPSADYGAGPALDHSVERTIRSFARKSSVSMKYGAMLFRIAGWFKPEVILELGTGLGISTIYLSSGYPEAPMHTFEGNMERTAFAAELVCRCGLEQVSIHWEELEQGFEDLLIQIANGADFTGRFLAFVDANHRYEPTVKYVKSLLARRGGEAVIILDDIYRGMRRHRYSKTNKDFDLNFLCDMQSIGGRPEKGLTVAMISPFFGDYELYEQARCLGESTANNKQIFIL